MDNEILGNATKTTAKVVGAVVFAEQIFGFLGNIVTLLSVAGQTAFNGTRNLSLEVLARMRQHRAVITRRIVLTVLVIMFLFVAGAIARYQSIWLSHFFMGTALLVLMLSLLTIISAIKAFSKITEIYAGAVDKSLQVVYDSVMLLADQLGMEIKDHKFDLINNKIFHAQINSLYQMLIYFGAIGTYVVIFPGWFSLGLIFIAAPMVITRTIIVWLFGSIDQVADKARLIPQGPSMKKLYKTLGFALTLLLIIGAYHTIFPESFQATVRGVNKIETGDGIPIYQIPVDVAVGAFEAVKSLFAEEAAVPVPVEKADHMVAFKESWLQLDQDKRIFWKEVGSALPDNNYLVNVNVTYKNGNMYVYGLAPSTAKEGVFALPLVDIKGEETVKLEFYLVRDRLQEKHRDYSLRVKTTPRKDGHIDLEVEMLSPRELAAFKKAAV